LDGNGRVGRLLITFLLVHRGVLERPLLYLSEYLRRYRSEYYDALMAVRQGDWEGWLEFFLRGVEQTSIEATRTSGEILRLRERHRAAVAAPAGGTGLRLLDMLFEQPIVSVNWVRSRLNVSYPTANKLVGSLEQLGLLREATGQRRNRVFRYEPYLDLFEQDDRRPDPSVNAPALARSDG
jgi:Fic family protein